MLILNVSVLCWSSMQLAQVDVLKTRSKRAVSTVSHGATVGKGGFDMKRTVSAQERNMSGVMDKRGWEARAS